MKNKPTKLSISNEYSMPRENLYFGKEYEDIKEPISQTEEHQSGNEFIAEPTEFLGTNKVIRNEKKKRDFTKLLRKMGYMVASTVAVVTISQAAGTSVKNIPDDAIEFNGHYYKIYDGKYTWTEAKELCEELGGHIAVISSEEEQKFIESINHVPRWIVFYSHLVTNERENYLNRGDGGQNGCICEWD